MTHQNSSEYNEWATQQKLLLILVEVLNNEAIQEARCLVELLQSHNYIRPLWENFCGNISKNSSDEEVLEQIHILKKTTQHRFTNEPGQRESQSSCAVLLEQFLK